MLAIAYQPLINSLVKERQAPAYHAAPLTDTAVILNAPPSSREFADPTIVIVTGVVDTVQ